MTVVQLSGFRGIGFVLYPALWGSCMKPLFVVLCLVGALGALGAEKPVWQPSPGHAQVPIWPGNAPDPQPVAGAEFVESSPKELVAGRPMQWDQVQFAPKLRFCPARQRPLSRSPS